MRTRTSTVAASGMLAMLTAAGTAHAQFDGFATPPDNYFVSDTTLDTVFLDANADGFMDVAVARDDFVAGTRDSVLVYLNNGDGTLAAPLSYGVGSGPKGIVADDFNNDGRPDLATANAQSSDVSILINSGAGFNPEIVSVLLHAPNALDTGEFNGDGNTDIVTASDTGDIINTLRGNGDGTFFVTATFPTTVFGGPSGQDPREVLLADLNDNGLDDAVVAGANEVVIMYNDGSGGFFNGEFALYYPSGSNTQGIAVGDLTSNGFPDIVAVSRDASTARVFRNNANGTFPTFTQIASLPTPTSPISVVLADLGNDPSPPPVSVDRGAEPAPMAALAPDGDLDIIVAAEGEHAIEAFLNSGGTFASAGAFPTTVGSPEEISVGDIDNDGDIDVAVPGLVGGLDIFRNRSNQIGGPEPVTDIVTPLDFTAGGCVSGLVPIRGVSYVPAPGEYDSDTLSYRALTDTSFTLLGTAGSPLQTPGTLYVVDTSTFEEGYYLFQLKTRSASGLSATDEVVLYVSQEFDTLSVSVGSLVGGLVCINGTVDDPNGGAIQYTVEYAPTGTGSWQPVDPANPVYTGPRINGRLANFDTTALADGLYDIRVIATNECGQSKRFDTTIEIDNTAPDAVILDPANCTSLYPGQNVPITGIADDLNLRSWTLQYTGGDTNGWVTIDSGNTPVIAGVLAEWKTKNLQPCSYTLRLLVTEETVSNCDNRRTSEFLTTVELRCPADINADGVLDNGDVFTFVQFFLQACVP